MRGMIKVTAALSLVLSSASFAEDIASYVTNYRLGITKYQGSGHCPGYFDVAESSRWYEGGAEMSATAWLQWMAGPFSFISSQDKSVTWGARLLSKYRHCHGHAKIISINGEWPEGANHLKAHFASGKVYFTLDISSYGDPVAITYQNIQSGNPKYRWAAAD